MYEANKRVKLADRLNKIGIEVYTPTKMEIRQWYDRKKKVSIPLLLSMVLVRLLEKELEAVFQVSRAARFLFEQRKRASVSNEECWQ